MEFKIDFEKEINSMLRSKIGLCPYFSKNNRRFFEKYMDMDHFFHRHCHHKFLSRNGFSHLRNLLKDETAFESPLFFLLFKSFVFSEIKFINNYIPQNSHEERLTGHLISEIANSLNIIKQTFKEKAFELYQDNIDLEFHYADLSSNNREKHTGADFGFIFHINLPDYPEIVKVAIFQSKKFNKSAIIDLNQIETLKNFADNSGFYCFYDMNNEERMSPLIQGVDPILSVLGKNDENFKSKSLQRNEITERYDGGVPLSVFLTFEMLNVENTSMKSFSNIWEAKNFIDNKNMNFSLSRVLTVSVGGVSNSRQDLKDLSRLFNFSEYREE